MTLRPSGLDGRGEFLSSSRLVSIDVDGEPITAQGADLADIIHSERTADRPRQNQMLPLLEAQPDEHNLAEDADLSPQTSSAEDTGFDQGL